MSEIMPTYIRQARALQERLKVAVDNVLGIDGAADGGGEYKPAIAPPRTGL